MASLKSYKAGKGKRLTRGQAIVLFCHECFGYLKHRDNSKASKNWNECTSEIKECTDKECPLYPFRTGKELPTYRAES